MAAFHLPLVALCAVLATAQESDGDSAWEGVEVEPLPDGIAVIENIVTIAVSCAVVIILSITVCVQICLTGSTRMPMLLLAMQLVGVFVSGVCTWVVTYTAAQSAIEQHASNLLIFAGLSASARTAEDLQRGEILTRIMAKNAEAGNFQLVKNGSHYPETFDYLLGLALSTIQERSSLSLLYFGNEHGELHGVEVMRHKNLSFTGTASLNVGGAPRRCEDTHAPYGSCTDRRWELKCVVNTDVWNTCRHPACADPVAGGSSCQFCLTALGAAQNDSIRCPGCVQCDGWLPGVLQEFEVSVDPLEWDLHPMVDLDAGWCEVSTGAPWEHGEGVSIVPGSRPDGGPARRWAGGREIAPARERCAFPYDPRVRPWYARVDGNQWSPVYEFVASEGRIEMGITTTRAVRNPAYNGKAYSAGVPADMADNPWLGVVAVDFGFSKFSYFLAALRPTPNSVVLVSDLEGTLCAGSLDLAEMTAATRDEKGRIKYHAVRVLSPEDWRRRDLADTFLMIAHKYGTLKAAHGHRAILMGPDSAVLNQPISLKSGLRWLMAVNMPYSDVTKEAQRAATVALILATIISFASGLLVSGMVALLLRPVGTLSQQMSQVANMDIHNLPPLRGGITTEVCRMVQDFAIMVASLKEYRSFLPPAVLALTERKYKARNSVFAFSPDSDGEGAAKDDATQRLPQLSQPKVRGALQLALSQATGRQRSEVEKLFSEHFQSSIADGDIGTAWYLLDCGWDAPPDLRAELPAHKPQRAVQAHTSTGPRASADRRVSQASSVSLADSRRNTLSSCATGANVQVSRFGDGADVPDQTVATVLLFPPKYKPESLAESAADISQWHSPKGLTHWDSVAVKNVIADFHQCHRHTTVEKLALWIYTAEVSKQALWAVWQGSGWVKLADIDLALPTVRMQTAERVRLPAEVSPQLGVECQPDGVTAELVASSPSGLGVYAVDGAPRLLRYENHHGGDAQLSPLRSPIAWAPHPDLLVSPDSAFSIARSAHAPPPSGVFEFIASRDFVTKIERRMWSSIPVELSSLTQLRKMCMAQKNQQRVDERICQKAAKVFEPEAEELSAFGARAAQLAVAIPVMYKAKCPAAKPSPESISHATELNIMQWQEESFLLGFTGAPRSVAYLAPDGSAPHRAHRFQRLDCPYQDQPYYLMNAAIRHQQGHRFGATLHLVAPSSKHPGGDIVTARQPQDTPPVPAPQRFEGEAGGEVLSAVWSGTAWNITLAAGGSLVAHDGVLNVNAWALPQYRSIIWHLDAALRSIPDNVGKKNQKGYRGLINVTLDTTVYCRGKVVVFGAFTSTSADQGVASGFAAGEERAAIFTMFGHTGRCISFWSRYAREKEVLYPPNTLHLVTEALSSEHAAILDKRKLQLFDLKELSAANAMYHMAREGALEVKEHPSLLRQIERARDRAADGDWAGAVRELLTEPVSSAMERRIVLPVLRHDTVGVVALLFSSPEGSELGAGLDVELWSNFFKHAEQVAETNGARVVATHVGAVLLQAVRSSLDMAARAAVTVAEKLLETGDENCVPGVEAPLSPGTVPLMNADAVTFSAVRRRRRGLAPRGDLLVHCGVSAGAVSSGFAGGQQQIEVADGPAVRRARRMAAYSKFYEMAEAITDDTCCGVAARMYKCTWTTDLMFFTAEGGIREPITCVGADRGGATPSVAMNTLDAGRVQCAWKAVLQADDESASDATTFIQKCVNEISEEGEGHRAVRALREAAARPVTYCCEFDPSL
eukprot:TRINITY_DN5223_c0_g1_i1.p1 TRINITY_DN5223_c0_g1~~TRINITY_DN5223_c0_g1_i1.p1  ORF type:complete len:1770 (+),score=309.42 TRINITY_DN5223_c0_g1_i1:90-5312(+)